MYIPVFDILTRRCGVMTSKDWYESIICENDPSLNDSDYLYEDSVIVTSESQYCLFVFF